MKNKKANALAKQGLENNIIDVLTGESIPLAKATEMQVSDYLSNVNALRRDLEKVEEKLKSEIKRRVGDEGTEFGRHRITRSYRGYFDTKRFEAEATKGERKVLERYEDLKKKFNLLREVTTIQ